MPDAPLDLFALQEPEPVPAGLIDLSRYRQRLAQLAGQSTYIGTSSRKYPGWCGMVCDEQRYVTRGKFSEAKFNKTCLARLLHPAEAQTTPDEATGADAVKGVSTAAW